MISDNWIYDKNKILICRRSQNKRSLSANFFGPETKSITFKTTPLLLDLLPVPWQLIALWPIGWSFRACLSVLPIFTIRTRHLCGPTENNLPLIHELALANSPLRLEPLVHIVVRERERSLILGFVFRSRDKCWKIFRTNDKIFGDSDLSAVFRSRLFLGLSVPGSYQVKIETRYELVKIKDLDLIIIKFQTRSISRSCIYVRV